MSRFDLSTFLPRSALPYRGSKFSWIVLVILGGVGLLRSAIHIFAPDGGAGSIAGIELAGLSAGVIVFTFAWSGVYQILFAVFQLVVAWRYRFLVPFALGLALLEQLMLQLVGRFKPIPAAAVSHTPPGAIGNRLALPLVALAFVLSLLGPRPGAEPRA